MSIGSNIFIKTLTRCLLEHQNRFQGHFRDFSVTFEYCFSDFLEKNAFSFRKNAVFLQKKIAFSFRKNGFFVQKDCLFLQKKLPFFRKKMPVQKKMVYSFNKNSLLLKKRSHLQKKWPYLQLKNGLFRKNCIFFQKKLPFPLDKIAFRQNCLFLYKKFPFLKKGLYPLEWAFLHFTFSPNFVTSPPSVKGSSLHWGTTLQGMMIRVHFIL